MANASFPGLLRAKARVLGGLTRSNLVVMGSVYVVLALLNVSGVVGGLVIVAVLLGMKQLERHLPVGFWRFLCAPKSLPYAYTLEALWRN